MTVPNPEHAQQQRHQRQAEQRRRFWRTTASERARAAPWETGAARDASRRPVWQQR